MAKITLSDRVFSVVARGEDCVLSYGAVPCAEWIDQILDGEYTAEIGIYAALTATLVGPTGASAISRALDEVNEELPEQRLDRLSSVWGSSAVKLVLRLRHCIRNSVYVSSLK